MNRLADETSPYLRQHADNPVDWWPWGADAFAEAASRDVPVLLSVGYSACHWCHVMAHESFEDEATAAVVNDLFVCVKVDREERPDVDAVYMDAVTAVSGGGGWPMTVWCTPDGRPFLAGTYFPKQRVHGRPAFVDVCRAVAQAWADQRPALEEQADQLRDAVVERSSLAHLALRLPQSDVDDQAVLDAGLAAVAAAFDAEHGGFGRAPKFPQPSWLELAMRGAAKQRRKEGAPEHAEASAWPGGKLEVVVRTTLDAMASGGIYDHLGGGFARYATDRRWLVPHFEKMLYDQAGLLRAFLHGWQLYGVDAWRQVCEEVVGYVERDLAQPEGGVSSAEDADSEGVEGRFYVWSLEELRRVGGEAAVAWYGATAEGSWEGTNILWRPERGDLLRPPEVEAARVRLLEHRGHRVRPGLDDKVLTEWNAMWAAGLAEAGLVLGRPEWVASAERTMTFLHDALRRPDGRWLRSWQRDGGARHLAVASDLAWVVEACTRLAEATGTAGWLARAGDAAGQLLDFYEDAEAGGIFTVASDGEQLLARQKDVSDGATPSANSVSAAALLRLGALTGEARWTDAARRILEAMAPLLAGAPTAVTGGLDVLASFVEGPTEIVVTGRRPDLVAAAARPFRPGRVVAWGERSAGPLWEGRDEDGVAYVCRSYACERSVATPEELTDLLERHST
ncbi:MAG TPA: thioredoxin domain-containing protein [Acidimicrobiales bacterium]|nr:thioredoxin domain-containing protein [Acidimicrobiales bacterium]